MEKGKDILDFSLSFRYEEAGCPSLTDAEGSIPEGRCIVLCGGSGSGKSTLLRTFNRLIPEFYEGDLKGFSHIAGKDSESLSIGETGMLASSVFQDPRSQFFTLSSTTEIAFGLENFGVPHDEMVKRVDEAFTKSGLERLRDRNVFELSSGERQLVAILAADAVDTDIMLLDEPTANLDAAAIESLRKLLFSLRKKGKTLIISEHRLYYLTGLADEYWYMEKGKIREKIPSSVMLSLSEEELGGRGLRTTDLSRIAVSRDKAVRAPEGCHTFRAEGMSFSYGTADEIISGLSVEARTGDVIGIVGPNGCGKTTFGKLAAGLLKPSKGSFLLDGKKLRTREISASSIFIMQEAEFQFFTNSVMNELNYGKKPTKERNEEIVRLLTMLGMEQCRNQHPFSLSGGQMQKLALLLAWFSEKPVVVLDEPTAGLDRESLVSVSRLIREMAKTRIVFIITHDAELLALSCTKALSMKKGRFGDEYDLTDDGGLRKLEAFMETGLVPEERKIGREKERKRLLDPRTKLFVFALSLAAGIFTDLPLICTVLAAVLIAAAYEGRWQIVLSGVASMGLLAGIYALWPNVGTSFMLFFFPRIILMSEGAWLIVQKSEAARSLAAFRAMHVPEGIIMVASVIFRFFPVLSKDLSMMNQSIRTRGFFPKFTDRLKSVPHYAEILIVPMVFRVIRIAEALSASAETRGIALKNRRESWVKLRLRPWDFIMALLAVILAVTGLLI